MRPVLDTDARRALAHYALARGDVREADVEGREAAALRITARWCVAASELEPAARPDVLPVLSALAGAVAAPTAGAFAALAEALTRWCQGAALPGLVDGEGRLAPLMLGAVDAAALCAQVQTEREPAAARR